MCVRASRHAVTHSTCALLRSAPESQSTERDLLVGVGNFSPHRVGRGGLSCEEEGCVSAWSTVQYIPGRAYKYSDPRTERVQENNFPKVWRWGIITEEEEAEDSSLIQRRIHTDKVRFPDTPTPSFFFSFFLIREMLSVNLKRYARELFLLLDNSFYRFIGLEGGSHPIKKRDI